MKPCSHKIPDTDCRICYLADNDPRYRKLWGMSEPSVALFRDQKDREIFDEVVTRNEYRLPEKFSPEDVILDIGAHAGYFARTCLMRGAGKIVCVEPNLQNHALIIANTGGIPWGATRLYPMAAWRCDRPAGKMILGHAPDDPHSTGFTVACPVDNLASVYAISFDSLLETIPEKIRLVKFDCEGAEWPILFTTQKLWDKAQEVVGEYHIRACDFLKEDSRVDGITYNLDSLKVLFSSHGWSFESRKNSVGNHTFWAKKPETLEKDTLLVDVSAGGVGDHMLALCICAGIKASGKHVTLQSKHTDWCELFPTAYSKLTGIPGRNGPKGINLIQTYFRQELPHRSSWPRWKYYANALKYEGKPVLPPIKIPEPAIKWAEPYKDYVVLSPYTTHGTRTWLLPHWLALEAELIKAGHKIVIIDHDRDKNRCNAFKSKKVLQQSPDRITAIIQGASCLVSADSGMAHVGGILGVKVVALCGFTVGEKIFAAYPRVISLQGILPCSGCYGQAPYQGICNQVCASLQTITIERVVKAIGPAKPVPASKPKTLIDFLPCIYRGESTGKTVMCDECGSRHKSTEILACSVHKECTVHVSKDKAIQSCRKCTDRPH